MGQCAGRLVGGAICRERSEWGNVQGDKWVGQHIGRGVSGATCREMSRCKIVGTHLFGVCVVCCVCVVYVLCVVCVLCVCCVLFLGSPGIRRVSSCTHQRT